jgi:putative hemolysin
MGVPFELLVLLGLVLVNGVLSGAEIAIVTVRATRLKQLVDEGSGAARAVERLRGQPERFLATVQIGITVVGATAGAFGGANFAADLSPLLEGLGVPAEHARWLAMTTVVAVLSFLSLVLGELVPKSLALRAPEGYALVIGWPLLALAWLMRPLVWLLTASSNVVLRLFGDRTTFIEARVSPQELQQLVREAAAAGTVHPQAGEIASRALDFPALRAMDVMIPRREVLAVARDASQEELQRAFLSQPHSRVPVYQETIDQVVGYVSLKDVLGPAWTQRTVELEPLIRPAFFVPERKPAPELLSEMRKRRQPFAIVVDEQGGFSGIVAMEDLVEELVGDIANEHARPASPFTAQPDGSVLLDGSAPLRDVNRALELELPEGPGWTTVAGLVLHEAQRIPQAGEAVTLADGTVLEVVDASARRVRRVRLRRP